MHGVKRLFSWMIPRFDPDRFRVSLVSLRKKDLSEETLEAQGVDITYLHRSKFDPLTLRDLLRVIDRQWQRRLVDIAAVASADHSRLRGCHSAAANENWATDSARAWSIAGRERGNFADPCSIHQRNGAEKIRHHRRRHERSHPSGALRELS